MRQDQNDSRSELARLRQQAEAITRQRPRDKRELSGLTADEIQRLVHELDVQHIELEMQNDELMAAQAALEQARDSYTELFDLAPVGYYRLDARGRIEQANLTGALLLGSDRDQLAQRPLHEFVARKDQDLFFRHLRQGLSRTGPACCELEMQRSDDSTFHAQIESVAQQTEAGGVGHYLTVILDITERKRAEAALQEADRRKDEFLAMLAHELRNPLAPIVNALHILDQQTMPEVTRQTACRIIDRQLSHMVRLIDDLLDVSRIAGGRLQLRKQRVELAEILQQSLEASRPRLEESGHRLSLSLGAEPVHLHADPVRLTQVFVNLLNNACIYTGKGGEIGLQVEVDDRQAVIRVTDTGIGIAAHHLPQLFSKFTQLDGAPDKNGLGIGLWLTRGLVESHDGSIEAYSEGLEKGSEFTVRLPILRSAASQRNEASVGRNESAMPSRILVVDDNQGAVASLALLLELNGNEVEKAHDGLEAVAAAERFRPDIILLDIGMPKLDGYAACRRIRELPRGDEFVIIALTGWGQESDRIKTSEVGFDAHLVKPVNPSVLTRLLDETLERRR